MTQLTIDQILSGTELRDGGIKRVLEHTPDDYKAQFELAVMNLHSSFTSDDVIKTVGMPPNHKNAVGALMNSLAKRKLIVKTGRYLKAQRPTRHAAIVAEWRRI